MRFTSRVMRTRLTSRRKLRAAQQERRLFKTKTLNLLPGERSLGHQMLRRVGLRYVLPAAKEAMHRDGNHPIRIVVFLQRRYLLCRVTQLTTVFAMFFSQMA